MKRYSKPLAFLILLALSGMLFGQPPQQGAPGISINFGNSGPEAVANTVQVFLLMTVLSLAPSILIMATSFTRIVIVFHFIRQALGTQNVPSNTVLTGLALVMTFYIMAPTFKQIKVEAYDPMRDGEIGVEEAIDRAVEPMKRFMLKHTREKDLALFVELSRQEKPPTRLEVPLEILVPAFIISELKTAFEIGFLVFLPFLIVDLVIASILLAMGMMMLPPIMISMPFKILLFVMVDGWHLIVTSMVMSFA